MVHCHFYGLLLKYVKSAHNSHAFASMTLLILIIVIGLVSWALRLMERAIASHEFSLMLAGFLVASSAAAMMAVYFLMGNYMIFMHQAGQPIDYADTLSFEDEQLLPAWVIDSQPASQLKSR
jgi:cbb3-type cytochrome oxidase subunit 3